MKSKSPISVSTWLYYAGMIFIALIFAFFMSDAIQKPFWLFAIPFCVLIAFSLLMEIWQHRAKPSHLETWLATLWKWLIRLFCFIGAMCFLGLAIWLTWAAIQERQFFLLGVAVMFLLFTLLVIHVGIYGSKVRGFRANQQIYREQKKRYGWKW